MRPRASTSMMTIMTARSRAEPPAGMSTARAEIPAAFEDDLIPGVADVPPQFDVERLKAVLQDLIACRQLLDSALKEG